MGRNETGYDDGMWMELAEDHIWRRNVVLAMSNLRILVQEND